MREREDGRVVEKENSQRATIFRPRRFASGDSFIFSLYSRPSAFSSPLVPANTGKRGRGKYRYTRGAIISRADRRGIVVRGKGTIGSIIEPPSRD